MSGKKFLFYLNGHAKPIAITDATDDRDIDEITISIAETINGSEICHFNTQFDSIIVKPNDIIAVYVSELDRIPNNNINKKQLEQNKKIDSISKTSYDVEEQIDDLILDEDEEETETYDSEYEKSIKVEDDGIDIPEEVLNMVETPVQSKIIQTKPQQLQTVKKDPYSQPSTNKTTQKSENKVIHSNGVIFEIEEEDGYKSNGSPI